MKKIMETSRRAEIYLTKSSAQTKKLGEFFAKNILKRSPTKKVIVLGLIGDLGGGKTTFLQGFAKGLGIKEKILSPTFIIMRRFRICANSRKFADFYHIDCYRIKRPEEILELGFKEIISNSKNLVAVEWAGRIKKILPKNVLILKFEFINRNTRKIVLKLINGK
ncbi:MAG: tRNA (adenosine(37)-N6)-threonylcarbamoyltransferase complex ATPase subunit type 1 TsaE [Candidatus Nealsonbacteria bacterium]|nr:tRNA (adenosine(37)-N6)-threonylcarbamoyltransferase complex ATPase subunit type 1 TsaE [Candidatus Nealsonbacteria bacterium]